uniref:RRM domain-containing protein n=1 Tax=Syphacia muris TaxID=451379 RepID=A0A0N5ATG6_9BILA
MSDSEAAVVAAKSPTMVVDSSSITATTTIIAEDEVSKMKSATIHSSSETAVGDADLLLNGNSETTITATEKVITSVEESIPFSSKDTLDSTICPASVDSKNEIVDSLVKHAVSEQNTSVDLSFKNKTTADSNAELNTTVEANGSLEVDASTAPLTFTNASECSSEDSTLKRNQKEPEYWAANTVASTSEGLSETLSVVDSKRKFRVLGLCFPGKWMENKAFLDILSKSETFHLWFEKSSEGNSKCGGASIVFDSVLEAKKAFVEVQQLKIEGCTIKLQASKLFYESSTNTDGVQTTEKTIFPFDLTANVGDSTFKLYAVHLHSSTNQDLLNTVFDKEYVKNVKLANDPYATTEMQAEIVFWSKEQADIALSEIVDLGVEELNRMELLNTSEYVTYMKKAADESVPQQRNTSSTLVISPESSSVPPVHVPLVPAPSLTVDDVARFLEEHVEKTRTNWAELNGVSELWKVCDDVSCEHGGIPDSLLKQALLIVLENHRNSNDGSWWKKSLDTLIQSWKKEVENTKSAPRESAVSMKAPTYSPPEVRKRRNRRNKANLSVLMGVGALLNTARTALAVDDGEVDVSEDENGVFSIDGQELTFESWGNLFKASSTKEEQKQLPINRDYWKLRYQRRKEIREKKMEEQKIKMMQESMKPLEDEMNEETTAIDEGVKESTIGSSAPDTTENGKKRKLEEGEMSSESSSSSSASSSSDESASSRNRRRKRRPHKKNNTGIQIPGAGANPRFTHILMWLYEQRRRLVRSLQPSQKITFASVLNQIVSSPHGMTSAQQSEMNAFMRDYATNSFSSK